MAKIRPNGRNLTAKLEWFRASGGILQFIMQLLRMKYPGMTNNFKLVLLAILDRIRPKGQGGAFPTFERIAEDAGVCRDTVWRALKYWQDRGVLAWSTKHGLYSNEYTLLKSPLDLRVSVTIQVDGQSLKIRPTKVGNSDFGQSENQTLSNTKGSQTTVSNSGTSPPNRGEPFTRGTDLGRSEGVSWIDKNGFVDPTAIDRTPSDASGDLGTAPTTFPAETTRQARQRDGLAISLGSGAEASGSNQEDDMSWRTGGYNMSGKAATDPRTGEDAMAKAEQATKRPTDAFRIWGHMQARAKTKMGMDLPGMMGWEAKMLQKLVDTDGYGAEAVMAMVDTLTDNWTAVRENLRIKEEAPTVKTLVFKAAELKGAKGRMLGKGMNWASPDIEEETKKAVAIQRAELLANKAAKLAGGMA